MDGGHDARSEAPHPNGALRPPRPARAHRVRRRLLAGGAVVFGLVWAYAIWYSVTRTNPEDLDDATVAAVEAECDAALARLRELPAFDPGGGVEDDAALIEDENAVFEAMIERLAAIEPDGPDPAAAREAYREWLGDWRALVDRRAAVVPDLLADGTARPDFRREGEPEPIGTRMQTYVNAQGLSACDPSRLQIENVDRPREYPREG
ncbi:MAG: hypothetical protein KatS3mg009_2683 [Acidimicrobiia bacterium]|nr:MAG: hypothetical protein KatS3mg009_2683 [Acidimicrobiia bacterium]